MEGTSRLTVREMSGTPKVRMSRRLRSAAVGRSVAKSERREDFRSIEQIGGGEVRPTVGRQRRADDLLNGHLAHR